MQKTLGWLVCCLLAGRVAQAQEAGQDPRVGEAKTACGAGDVQNGVRLLAELYTASGDPIWIFDQGRCFQENDQLTLALTRFKEFLRKSEGTPNEDIRDAQSYIAEIEAELQRSQSASRNAAPPPAEPAATASTAGAKPGRGLRYGGIGAIIVGGAAVATGVVFSVLVKKTANDIESQANQTGGANWSAVSGKYSDGSRYQTLQWMSYGVGAAALIAGGVLCWVGSASAKPQMSATYVFPVFMASGGGAGGGAGLHVAF